MKPSKAHFRWVLPVLLFLALFFAGFFFLYVPVQITGSDNSLLSNGQIYLYQKISYLFRQPQVGDLVVFKSSSLSQFPSIGFIARIDTTTDTKFSVTASKHPRNLWIVSREQIVGRVYYPSIPSIPTQDLLPLPTPTHTPTPTLIPPTRRPTRALTPTVTLTPTIDNNTAPTVPPRSNPGLSCAIVARATNEGVPQTYNLIYSASNMGGDNYVTGIQWDYNGDGNWDSDLSLNNGNVNYTYSARGIYTIRMKIQTRNGSTAECSTQVGVQPR